MSLVRSWRTALLRASGAIALVPVGLLLAVVLAASLTGVGGIGRIGQLVAGPGLPPASVAEVRLGPGALGAVPAVPAPSPRAEAVLRRIGAAPGDARSRGSERGARRRSERGRSRRPSARRPGSRRPPARSPSRPPTGSPPPAGPGTGGGGGSADEPLPGPPRQTGLIRRIGAQVDRVVRPVPAVGPPAADAVNTVVQLLDPPPSGGAGAPAGVPAPRELVKPAG